MRDVQLVCFSEADDEWVQRFIALPATQAYGLRKFPAPAQYRTHVATLRQLPNAPTQERLCALAQRAWHVRGQTGCLFALLAARAADTLRWEYVVLGATLSDLEPETAVALGEHLDRAVDDTRIQVLSILFPGITEATEAVTGIRGLTARTNFGLERDEIAGSSLRLHLRYPIGGSGAQAWVMAFAPFEFVPNTRRGPYFELAVRVKEKPSRIFHRVNQDRAVAHLADVPLVMKDKYWEHRWWSTLRRTRMILDGEPNDISAAKATLAVPIDFL